MRTCFTLLWHLPGRPCIIGDDRFKDEPITVSPKKTEYGTFMIIEGDMIVGKREQLVLANLNQLREEAQSLNLGDAGLGRFLTTNQRAIIEALQTLPSPGAEQERLLKTAVAQSRISPLVNRATQLVKSVGDKDGFLPRQLVETVKNQTNLQNPASVGSDCWASISLAKRGDSLFLRRKYLAVEPPADHRRGRSPLESGDRPDLPSPDKGDRPLLR